MIINIILIIAIIILAFIWTNYNNLVKLENYIEEAKSDIDVLLKKRFDLIPNIVETVKGYAKHESSTLTELTKMRSNANNIEKLGVDERLKIDNQITKVMLLAESYPDLKANTEFLNLQKQLSEIEDKIVVSRKIYNHRVTNYNNKVESFPSEIVAKLFGFKEGEFFKLDSDEERQNVKIDL